MPKNPRSGSGTESRCPLLKHSILPEVDGLIGISAEEVIVLWSRGAERIFGWAKNDVVGRRMADLIVPKRFRSAHRRGMTHFLLTGESRVQNKVIELPALKADGSEFLIQLTLTCVKGHGGTRFYAVIRASTQAILHPLSPLL